VVFAKNLVKGSHFQEIIHLLRLRKNGGSNFLSPDIVPEKIAPVHDS
jgi:hypothetical protein